jgi:hypothetical protein
MSRRDFDAEGSVEVRAAVCGRPGSARAVLRIAEVFFIGYPYQELTVCCSDLSRRWSREPTSLLRSLCERLETGDCSFLRTEPGRPLRW